MNECTNCGHEHDEETCPDCGYREMEIDDRDMEDNKKW